MLLALTATVALAGGVNIAWGTICYTEAGPGSELTTFACTTNSAAGHRFMTASFMLDTPMPDMVGMELLIEGQSDAPVLPDWWQLSADVNDCRSGKATFASDFTLVEDSCIDWTAGGGFNAPNYLWDTNKAHITLGVAIDAGTPYAAQPGVEYYAGKVTILNSKTVGTPSCAGCLIGMLFGLHHVTAAALSGATDTYYEPIPGGNQCLNWNNSIQNCEAPVPARNATWGQVKSLYR
jgi:hypothetical protein